MNDPIVAVSAYTVSLLPDDHPDRHVWSLTVEYRGRGLWAVKSLSRCLNRRGKLDLEPIPSSRTDRWLKAHRFTEQEALDIAKRHVGKLVFNGMRVVDGELVRESA